MLEKISSTIKDFLGDSNEFIESATIAAEDRITSPFYGYFLISWFIFNWKIVYVAFFIDQTKLYEKTGLLRNEYLNSIIPSHLSWNFWFYFAICPFLLTVFFFWISPYFTRHFFRKNIRNKKQLKIIELQESQEVKKEEKALVKAETALIEEKVEKVKREKKAVKETPEVIWENEFEIFRKHPIYSGMDSLKKILYERSGLTREWDGNQYRLMINSDILAAADSRGLVEIQGSGKLEKIELTPKGKFFMAKFLEGK